MSLSRTLSALFRGQQNNLPQQASHNHQANANDWMPFQKPRAHPKYQDEKLFNVITERRPVYGPERYRGGEFTRSPYFQHSLTMYERQFQGEQITQTLYGLGQEMSSRSSFAPAYRTENGAYRYGNNYACLPGQSPFSRESLALRGYRGWGPSMPVSRSYGSDTSSNSSYGSFNGGYYGARFEYGGYKQNLSDYYPYSNSSYGSFNGGYHGRQFGYGGYKHSPYSNQPGYCNYSDTSSNSSYGSLNGWSRNIW